MRHICNPFVRQARYPHPNHFNSEEQDTDLMHMKLESHESLVRHNTYKIFLVTLCPHSLDLQEGEKTWQDYINRKLAR